MGVYLKLLALNRKNFQFRYILILLNAAKSEFLDCRNVHSLLLKFPSYGRWKVIADLMHFSSQNLYIPFINRNSPAGNYMFKVNNRNTRTRSEICSKLTIKTPERRQWRFTSILTSCWTFFKDVVRSIIVFAIHWLLCRSRGH